MKNKTSLYVTGIGAVVTGAGALIGGPLGAGVAGFGAAHIALGILDNFRPVVRK